MYGNQDSLLDQHYDTFLKLPDKYKQGKKKCVLMQIMEAVSQDHASYKSKCCTTANDP